jgi:WD40 repeat protein
VKLSFDARKEGDVAPVTLSVSVQPPPPQPDAPKFEPVSEAFVATLPQAVKTSGLGAVQYSPDGKRLLVTGYPSGVIQFWEVDARKETFRVESPKGWRVSADFALITPDWKTLHVATQEEKITRVGRDGKKADRCEQVGRIRRWDVATRKELAAFDPPAGWGNLLAGISADGRFVFSHEEQARLRDEAPAGRVAVWETATGRRTVIDNKMWSVPPRLLPGARIATVSTDKDGAATIVVYSLPDGKTQARKTYPLELKANAQIADVSADGELLAVNTGGKKGATTTTVFLDTKTLNEVARWAGPAKPILFGHTDGVFAPDGKRFLAIDGENNLNVFDLAAKKTVRAVKLDGTPLWHRVSPDGRWFATHWTPKGPDPHPGQQLDPAAMAQPRVILVDLTDAATKPVTLTAPRGDAWGMAFRPDGKQLALGGTGGVHLFDLTKLGR